MWNEQLVNALPNFFFFFIKMKSQRYVKLHGHIEEAEFAKPEMKDSNGDPCIFVAKARKEHGCHLWNNKRDTIRCKKMLGGCSLERIVHIVLDLEAFLRGRGFWICRL